MIESVIIYENYNPGAVVALYAFNYDKKKWIQIWSVFGNSKINSNLKGLQRQIPKKESRKFRPNLSIKNIYSK